MYALKINKRFLTVCLRTLEKNITDKIVLNKFLFATTYYYDTCEIH